MKDRKLVTVNGGNHVSPRMTLSNVNTSYAGRPIKKKVVDTSFFSSVLDRLGQKTEDEGLPSALLGK